MVRAEILSADMIVFATPLYYYGFSAQLKTLIDRFCAFNFEIESRHLRSALLVSAWNSADWTFDAIKAHYQTLVRYLGFKDEGMVQDVIKSFNEEGFRCSLDDFGAGNASFSVLLKGYINTIKLDRIFFKDEITEQRKKVISNIIEIGKALDVDVVAEGVEDKEYIDFLKTTDCRIVQGFYYYYPMPLHEFQRLLDRQ